MWQFLSIADLMTELSYKYKIHGLRKGRKNNKFIVSNDGSINENNIDELFCELDHAEVVETLIRRLSTWGQAHLTICGYYRDVDEEDAVEADEDFVDVIKLIRRDYLPSFPEDPTDISPCDF